MQKNTYCIIMAGGIGVRFWPLSRNKRPKQFLDILGVGRTFIQQTYDRFARIIPSENFLVVTSTDYKDIVLEQLPDLTEDQVLCEPMRRNTAPCIAYATYKLLQKNPDANIVVTPADHLILNETNFLEVILNSLAYAEKENALVTIGLKPSRPETGYGYIQVDKDEKELCSGTVCKVKTFTEKPDAQTAKIFVDSGEFFWNSGIFIWTLQTIKQAFEENLPDIAEAFAAGESKYYTDAESQFIFDTYSVCKNISIDYGIMEKALNVYMIAAEFGWSDVGTWESLYRQLDKDDNGNAVKAENAVLRDTKDSLITETTGKLVVVSGLDNYLVVDTDEVLMICPRTNEEGIKQLIADVIIEKGLDQS